MAQARTTTKTTTDTSPADTKPEAETPEVKHDEAKAAANAPDVLVHTASTEFSGPVTIPEATTSGTEQVTLVREAGGHKPGDTITVTTGAAEYLRDQGYTDAE